MSSSGEPVIDGEAGAIPGLGLDWLFKTPDIGVVRWDCSETGRRELSEEKLQLWHVVSFVHGGAFILHTEGRTAMIDPTSVVLYNPGVPSRTEHPFGCCDHGSAIVVRQGALSDVMAHHDPAALESPRGLFPGSHTQGLSRAYLFQRLLLQRLKAGTAEPLAVEEAALGILGEVAEGCGRTRGRSHSLHRDPARARRGYAEDTKALLQDRFREPLRLDDIARALHVSPYHLSRLFKAQTGVPVHRYLNRLRLRHALEGIAERNVDLTRLALDLGFSSHSHFTAAFRKEFGITPREARRLARSEPERRPAA